MDEMQGLYRYETAPGRWWATVVQSDGQRVNIIERRYVEMGIDPPFWELPIGDGNGKRKIA